MHQNSLSSAGRSGRVGADNRASATPKLIAHGRTTTDARMFVLMAEDHTALVKIVGRHFDCHAIAGQSLDSVLLHLAVYATTSYPASSCTALGAVGKVSVTTPSNCVSYSLGTFYSFGLLTSPRRESVLWPDRMSRCRKAAAAIPFGPFRSCSCRSCLRGALPRPRCRRLAAAWGNGREVRLSVIDR